MILYYVFILCIYINIYIEYNNRFYLTKIDNYYLLKYLSN